MDRIEHEALVRRLYKARHAKDYRTVIAGFHPQAHFRLVGVVPGTPFSGLRIGRDRIFESIQQFDVAFEMFDFEVTEIIFEDPKAALTWRTRIRNRGAGPTLEIEGSDFAAYEDGLIISFTQYYDTAAMAELFNRSL